jgi:hypothetical protein
MVFSFRPLLYIIHKHRVSRLNFIIDNCCFPSATTAPTYTGRAETLVFISYDKKKPLRKKNQNTSHPFFIYSAYINEKNLTYTRARVIIEFARARCTYFIFYFFMKRPSRIYNII